MTRICVLVATIVLAMLVVSACSSRDSNSPTPGSTLLFDELFETLAGYPYAEIHHHGISAGVIEILERSRDKGRVTRADVDEALNSTTTCFDQHNIGWDYMIGTDMFGLPARELTYWAPPGIDRTDVDHPWLDLSSECQFNNSFIVQAIYDNQVRSAEEIARFMETRGGTVIDCLNNAGVALSENATIDQMIDEAKALVDATGDSSCLQAVFD